MGIIKAVTASVASVTADQWKEYFICESPGADILMIRGQKRVSERSENTGGDDNVITDGSVFALPDGMAAIVVSGGRVTDVCTEPG